MDRGLKLFDTFLADRGIYTSIEALEITGQCLVFMSKNRRKYRFTEKMIVKEERRIKGLLKLVKKRPKKNVVH